MAEPLALAWAACFVLVLSEYATFHLAGVETLGAQLAVVYEFTGSTEAVARAAWPLVLVAAAVAAALTWGLRGRGEPQLHEPPREVRPWQWAVVAILAAVSLGAPLAILLTGLHGTGALGQFWSLQRDGLANSLLAAAAATVIALVAAAGVQALDRWGRGGRLLAAVMGTALLAAMFLPGSLVGAALLRVQILIGIPTPVGGGWWLLAVGQAARFAGVVVVIFRLARDSTDRHYDEMAGVDGAGWWAAGWHVRWPRAWPLVAGACVLTLMLSLTEVPATMMLLPPGVANFTQRLLNQMHYARDQHVIASCLALIGVYLVLVVPAVLVAVARLGRAPAAVLLVAAMIVGVSGCEPGVASPSGVQVLQIIGTSGRGPCEFLYPRAIAIDAGGDLFVADRTGRIQHLTGAGKMVDVIRLPETEKGYPTGMTVGPDGSLYVADTHYHRVLVYGKDGRLVRQFGGFGTGDGQFIYPTHVAIGPDGRVFVSEYGGNDRVSVWSPEGRFLDAFGRPGSGSGEFSRPSALALDAGRGILYVADACNHRIARYTLAGNLVGYFGSVGTGPGELRYPYGLALASDGRLVVCENGNNRVQVFSPEGASLRCLGLAGREPGQLAYPWGVAVDRQGHVFVVDAGNNRIQVWAL
jgi:DNA-binding beta-propeller fold protein YncE